MYRVYMYTYTHRYMSKIKNFHIPIIITNYQKIVTNYQKTLESVDFVYSFQHEN